MNILIVKLSAIGDVILSLPFLEALKHRYPQARITWLVEEAAADLVTGHPALDRVVISRRKTWLKLIKQGRATKAFKDIARFYRELRAETYDLAIDLQGLFKSGILTYMSGARVRLGFDHTREQAYRFLNQRLVPYDPDRHALLRYLDVAAHLGADVTEPRFRLPIDSEAAAQAAQLLVGLPRPLVALNPGAKWDTKLWPESAWHQLCRRLTTESGLNIILTGSPDERPMTETIAEGLDGVTNLTGRTGLRVLAEIFRKADLVVCPDTGPMHLAAAVETPVVALFGPTAPWRTGPFGSSHEVIRPEIDCSPCFKRKCDHWRCMPSIDADHVFEVAMDKLRTLS
jgi:heptosyltransferase I